MTSTPRALRVFECREWVKGAMSNGEMEQWAIERMEQWMHPPRPPPSLPHQGHRLSLNVHCRVDMCVRVCARESVCDACAMPCGLGR
jgi:hypothetical protein